MRTILRAALAVLFAFAFLAAGCGKKAKPVATAPNKAAPRASEASEFYDALAGIQKRYEDAYLDFAKGISSPGHEGSLKGLQEAPERLAKALGTARSDLKKIQVPDVKGAKQLLEANDQFLKAEEDTIKISSQMTKAIEDIGAGRASPVELANSLERMKNDRKRIKDELTKVQESFAKTHKL